MAAKRKYMDTELPPQESEGKVVEVHNFWPLASLHDACLHHGLCTPGDVSLSVGYCI